MRKPNPCEGSMEMNHYYESDLGLNPYNGGTQRAVLRHIELEIL